MSTTSWMSGHVRERHASHTATPPKTATAAKATTTGALATEVRFNDPLVGLNDARWAFRDLVAVIENEDGLAEAHHDFHIVFDEQHGLAGVTQPCDRLEQI